MKKIISLFFLLSLFIISLAQFPNAGGASRMGSTQMAGRFYGKIVDATSNKGVEAVSIQLLQNKFDSVSRKRKEVIIAGMLTKQNGEFTLENVPLFGQFKLKISAISYVTIEKTVAFDIKMNNTGSPDMSQLLNSIDKDLGNIKIELEEKTLSTVTVNSSKPLLQLGIDRKIFSVDKSIVATGGTAVDVMRNVPSLTVDLDGNVSLRNNAPQVFVDGRPTTMQLDQIPADAIESVEIITNPSAKFDASGGTSGILNVVLKKNKKVGFNGSVRTNIDSRLKIGGGADINIRQQKINLFASGNYFQRKSISTGNTDRLTTTGFPITHLYQDDYSEMSSKMRFGRTGLDYFIDNRSTLSANISFAGGSFSPLTETDLLTDSLFPIIKSNFTERNSTTSGNFNHIGRQLNFKHNFPKPGREVTADITFNSRSNSNTNNIETINYTHLSSFVPFFNQQQKGAGKGKNIIIQSDFINPITEKSKLEIGGRFALNTSNSTNAFYMVSPITGELILQPSTAIDYESEERIYAGYVTFSNQLKLFSYQLGLRSESSTYRGNLIKTNEIFNNDFPVSFFPCIFLSKKLKAEQELQINYTRRINRPNFFQLSPFTDSSDFLNINKGNPGLNPEFTNSFELSYQKLFKNNNNLLASIYYKNTDQLITRFQQKLTDPNNGKDKILNTYINANSSYVTGLEMTLKNKLATWWDLTSNFNLFTSKIDISDLNQPEQKQFASWFGKINNTFKLPKNFTVQLSGEYQSKTILPPGGSGNKGGGGGFMGGMGMYGQATSSQGFVRANYFMDAAIRLDFLKTKTASISLNVNDIFKTRKSAIHSESPYFIQDVNRQRDPQIFRLNFNWRFGKFDANLFKRKNLKLERENMNSMDINM